MQLPVRLLPPVSLEEVDGQVYWGSEGDGNGASESSVRRERPRRRRRLGARFHPETGYVCYPAAC